MVSSFCKLESSYAFVKSLLSFYKICFLYTHDNSSKNITVLADPTFLILQLPTELPHYKCVLLDNMVIMIIKVTLFNSYKMN